MTGQAPFKTWEATVRWIREQNGSRDLVLAAYYDDPLSGAATRYWKSDEWAAIQVYLPKLRGCALDVGAGRGIASFALANDGFAVTALEPDPSDLVGAGAIRSLAIEHGLSIEVAQEFSERLPFADSTFDIVFARAVLHHTSDLGAACREFFRVLKPGGRLIAVREHVISRPQDLPKFLDQHPLHKLYGGENAFQLDRYTEAIEASGLQLAAVLGPLDTVINYAPYTFDTLRVEIASRVIWPLRGIIRRLLGITLVWSFARRFLTFLDHRPGRLYSFVADRP